MSRLGGGGDISAIFVHAGAGFHAPHNEKAHLETCDNAARVAMAVLKNGGSAVDAVEAAIMVLEDSDITNAGYNSNLNIEGKVECDATMVDHLGRSGAVGATAQVKNPISLARVILDASSRPLSLSRVPPNFLVGQGATEYAYEHGLVVLPPDALISPGARDRWKHWRRELEAATLRERKQHGDHDPHRAFIRRSVSVNPAQMLEPLSRPASVTGISSPVVIKGTTADPRLTRQPHGITPPAGPDCSPSDSPRVKDAKFVDGIQHAASATWPSGDGNLSLTDGNSPSPSAVEPLRSSDATEIDRVNDTVGAIAIDSYGNIAAGSSSGGIGMKHRGRIGPAALVGIGTFVIPVDPGDPEATSVATVTSGTGEHIATTMAASTCASRVYYSHRRCKDGSLEEVTEEEAIRAVIADDFMAHPGVRGSISHGAIGIVSVKKSVDGIFLYFAHNTDSFALASMSSADKKPVCVMSRSSGGGSIAQGGRACRPKR
ncbi:N-terminal nucleophile aminohydrolase [Aspergillus sclerotioniger CBS 115572]|uniref:N-terminal nucleophile aminohydrolase n=1 Tax=Aspergillus sclerotioniger CBS 115572 TaxID=1450535 RepID=A0A317XG46_9EURO|nr:N-terminal nucleophile aminohydrolase [Aspergillus sclerotioniger CBS 115572]PWY95820.1 N-terminal nucleophile aminohydrolase [Aspergillus sclerotioniger CBS 115572]